MAHFPDADAMPIVWRLCPGGRGPDQRVWTPRSVEIGFSCLGEAAFIPLLHAIHCGQSYSCHWYVSLAKTRFRRAYLRFSYTNKSWNNNKLCVWTLKKHFNCCYRVRREFFVQLFPGFKLGCQIELNKLNKINFIPVFYGLIVNCCNMNILWQVNFSYNYSRVLRSNCCCFCSSSSSSYIRSFG